MSVPDGHRAALASRLNHHDLAGDLTAREAYLLGRYGVWLQGLAEKTLEPTTERQRAFAHVMDRDGEGTDDFERAWKKHAVPTYTRLMTQLVERHRAGGEGYGDLKETLWVPSGSAKWERFGFTLTQPEKDFFHRLEGECEDKYGLAALVRDPQGVFGTLLELYRSGTANPATAAEKIIEGLVVPHVAILYDPGDSSSNGTIADDGWLEAYCATKAFRLPCDETSNGLLGVFAPQGFAYEYVLPMANVDSFVVEYLTISARAGRYGREAMRALFSCQLDAKYAAYDRAMEAERENDHCDSWEPEDVDITTKYPEFDPEDPDDYDYIQDQADPEDPPELDDPT